MPGVDPLVLLLAPLLRTPPPVPHDPGSPLKERRRLQGQVRVHPVEILATRPWPAYCPSLDPCPISVSRSPHISRMQRWKPGHQICTSSTLADSWIKMMTGTHKVRTKRRKRRKMTK